MPAIKNLVIVKGDTFSQVVRWEAPPVIYKPITNIAQVAPVSITVAAHGIPDGWRVAVASVKGMTEINAQNAPPKDSEYRPASVVDVNTITLNDVNAFEFSRYLTGGYVQFNTPVDLTGFTARMSIKDAAGGIELLRLDTVNGRVAVSNATKTITLTIDAATTAALPWDAGVYDFEMVSAGGVVTKLLSGVISAPSEVTTT